MTPTKFQNKVAEILGRPLGPRHSVSLPVTTPPGALYVRVDLFSIRIIFQGSPLPEFVNQDTGAWHIGEPADTYVQGRENLKELERRLGLVGYVKPERWVPEVMSLPGTESRKPDTGLSFSVAEIDGETHVTVAEGKYTVIHRNGMDFRALRYGEPWKRNLTGDNLVYWMACHLEQAYAEIMTYRAFDAVDPGEGVRTGTMPRESEDTAPLTGAEINQLTMENLGDWPSFEAQSWACRVAKMVLQHRAHSGLTLTEEEKETLKVLLGEGIEQFDDLAPTLKDRPSILKVLENKCRDFKSILLKLQS